MAIIEKSFYKDDPVGNEVYYAEAFKNLDLMNISRKSPAMATLSTIFNSEFYKLKDIDADEIFVTIQDHGIFKENVIRMNMNVAAEICQFFGFVFNGFVGSVGGKLASLDQPPIKNVKIFVFTEKHGKQTNLVSINDFIDCLDVTNNVPSGIRDYPTIIKITDTLEETSKMIDSLEASGIDAKEKMNKLISEEKEFAGKLGVLYSDLAVDILSACAKAVDRDEVDVEDIYNITFLFEQTLRTDTGAPHKRISAISYHDAFNAVVHSIKGTFRINK